ncbi:MAG: hypothetical protein JW939_07410, partial [Candidatus Thermoplasmatota archaeon]|nr:hypothetical protein [Candidatus Thermoplasmatota archaeon]
MSGRKSTVLGLVALSVVILIAVGTMAYWPRNDGNDRGADLLRDDNGNEGPVLPDGDSDDEGPLLPTPDDTIEPPPDDDLHDEPGPEPGPDHDPEEPMPEIPDLERQPERKWTLIFYVAYDNSIGPMEAWESDLYHLELFGSTEEVNLVALVDQEIEGDCEFLFIQKGTSYCYPVSSIDPDWTDELNTGSSEVLCGYVTWAMEMFPAEHFNLHFMDHGAGWLGAGIDETSDGAFLESWEIGEALENSVKKNGQRIDVMSMDACFMANLEFGYEVSNAADILVGYEPMAVGDTGEDMYLTGNIEMKDVWETLIEDPDMTPEELAITMVLNSNIIGPYLYPQLGMAHLESSDTVGAFHLTYFEELRNAMDRLSVELIDSVTGESEVLAERQL